MKPKYPGRMNLTQWRRTPYGVKHRLVGIEINGFLGYWRSCADRRCRRARRCEDYECYWRRLHALPVEERSAVRSAVKPFEKLLWLGSNKGAERL
jgi:hypothetical protein